MAETFKYDMTTECGKEEILKYLNSIEETEVLDDIYVTELLDKIIDYEKLAGDEDNRKFWLWYMEEEFKDIFRKKLITDYYVVRIRKKLCEYSYAFNIFTKIYSKYKK